MFLWSAPKTHLKDFFFTTKLNDSFTEAKVNLEYEIEGTDFEGCTLDAKLKSADGKTITLGMMEGLDL